MHVSGAGVFGVSVRDRIVKAADLSVIAATTGIEASPQLGLL
jgi:hypothetical protein